MVLCILVLLIIYLLRYLLRRTYEHQQKAVKGFMAKYDIIKLVYA